MDNFSTDGESDIIATEELEGSAERYGNTFLLIWKSILIMKQHVIIIIIFIIIS